MDKKFLTVSRISAGYADGSLTPEKVLDLCRMNIDRHNALLNAVVTPTYERAEKDLAGLKEIDPASPVWGIPMVHKDVIWTKDILTTAGSPLMRDFIPDRDAPAISQLAASGGVLLGKANTHEWAFGPTNECSCFGPCRNPWNPERITGGSSGGSACAVAAGMAVAALGTDTGGSVRIPSSICGVVGFKPTNGIISTEHVFPVSGTFDCIGPLTSGVPDAALVTDGASGGSGSIGRSHLARELDGSTDLHGVVLAIPSDEYFAITVPTVQEVFDRAVRKLESLGAKIVEMRVPYSDQFPFIASAIMCPETTFYHGERFFANKDQYSEGVRERLERGLHYRAIDYVEAKHKLRDARREYAAAMEHIHAILTPTIPVEPHIIGQVFTTVLHEGQKGKELFPEYPRYTRFANFMDAPSLSVPCGVSVTGMPVGLMLTGRAHADGELLRIGHAYELAVGGFPVPPSL